MDPAGKLETLRDKIEDTDKNREIWDEWISPYSWIGGLAAPDLAAPTLLHFGCTNLDLRKTNFTIYDIFSEIQFICMKKEPSLMSIDIVNFKQRDETANHGEWVKKRRTIRCWNSPGKSLPSRASSENKFQVANLILVQNCTLSGILLWILSISESDIYCGARKYVWNEIRSRRKIMHKII